MSQITPASTDRFTEPRHQLNNAALTMLLAAILTAIAPLWYLFVTGESCGLFATVLLLMPSVLTAFGAVSLLPIQQRPGLLTLGTAAFDTFKNLLVAAYVVMRRNDATSNHLQIVSLASLFAGFILVVLVYRLTSWIMSYARDQSRLDADSNARRRGVIQQLLRHGFLSICGLLVAYLHLLLFLGLSIAFHDLAVGGGTIERLVRRVPDTLRPPPSAEGEARKPRSAGFWPDNSGSVHTFAFPEGSANLRCTSAVDLDSLDKRFFDVGTAFEWRLDQVRERYPSADGECASHLRATTWNLSELSTLRTELAQLYKERPFDRYRGVIIAHASDKATKAAFSSNYEMSRARAEQVQVLVESILSKVRGEGEGRPPLNVEWLIIPSGTGTTFLAADDSLQAAKRKEAQLVRELSAEIQFVRIPGHLTSLHRQSLEPRKGPAESELQLLDYVYFMMTVAAANDLAPASGFVQFVTAVAHIFQLFFFVVAFNVILAFRREPLPSNGEGPSQQAAAA